MAVNKILTLTWGVPDPSELLQSLQKLGWEPVWVADVVQARQALAQHQVKAGTFILGSLQLGISHGTPSSGVRHLIAAIKTLQELQGIEWIALCDASAVHSPQIRSLLLEDFFDYHCCPPNWEEVAGVLSYLARRWELHHSHKESTRPRISAEFLGMVGQSPAMERLRRMIHKVAATDATVLICGESGCGKELATRAIHTCSRRSNGPFMAVNCAAIPPSLMQSELFGYEKGAFTGATARKQGLIESANGGTLFLDEIGDLSLELQANLLRFLQERNIYRVGGLESIPLDTRVIAATHVKLQDAVAQGRFREDLFYRLNVLPIEIPPLRERREDIPLLAQHFFTQCLNGHGERLQGFSQGALDAMISYDWPGNVRELHNRVQRAFIMAEGKWITEADLGLESVQPIHSMGLEDARFKAEREVIRQTLSKAGHNISRAARELGISRMTLYRLMDKHGLV